MWALTTIVYVHAHILLCCLLQGKELLSPGKNAMYNEEHKIVTPMNVGPLNSLSLYTEVTAVALMLSGVFQFVCSLAKTRLCCVSCVHNSWLQALLFMIDF